MKDMGEASVILGVKVVKKGDSILLSQGHYVERLFKKFDYYDCKFVTTPYNVNSQLKQNKGDYFAQSRYAQIIGSLLHLMNFSRPHIGYVVSRLSRYTHSPNQNHWEALARLMRYLRGTMDYGIEYSGFLVVLEGHSDANWISNLDETKSSSGYVFTLGGGAIAWRSVRKSIIARSTMESEFVALEMTRTEAEWLRNFLVNIPLGMKPTPSVSIHYSSQLAIAIAKNKSYNGKNRHI
uniref:Retrovirus-related Pol polyprotein from transposon TNT 1-94 n=1 Tax=Cajanus cajan TaxID=3821 RepID=A0A151SIM3_CAJCA|nr:Retrovirus-related Pol polyprotein from transposon TNT 1-94 [Cajanus cajan]